MAESFPEPDVRVSGYLDGDCPNCGRRRLELYVDQAGERAAGVACEKCSAQWLLDPSKADFQGEHSRLNPLRPVADDDYPDFGAPLAESDAAVTPDTEKGKPQAK